MSLGAGTLAGKGADAPTAAWPLAPPETSSFGVFRDAGALAIILLEGVNQMLKCVMQPCSDNDTGFLQKPRPPRFRDVKMTVWATIGLVLLALGIDLMLTLR